MEIVVDWSWIGEGYGFVVPSSRPPHLLRPPSGPKLHPVGGCGVSEPCLGAVESLES